ncbi:hypothetical protein [Psychrobacillus sp. NEAU-3TGS]|nr:hypothetical protein [Psychrobacillus sp. NEAU-3TGS]
MDNLKQKLDNRLVLGQSFAKDGQSNIKLGQSPSISGQFKAEVGQSPST